MWSDDSSKILTASYGVECVIHEITVASRSRRRIFSNPDEPCWLSDWSRDGRLVVYHSWVGGIHKVYLLPMMVEPQPQLIASGKYAVDEFHFSPDGKWLAFNSNETGRFEVYAASLPSFTVKQQVSINGGVQPVWRSDGRALYFLSRDGKMMSAAIQAGASLKMEVPATLFQTQIPAPSFDSAAYQVTRDGRFLFRERTMTPVPGRSLWS